VDLLTDPLFMTVAVIGVCLLGVSKGGFLGLGVMALPLMSLFVPPLQAQPSFCPPRWRKTRSRCGPTGGNGAPGT
jgi:hypothetical protein